MTNRDQLVRERAHQIWEQEGRPHGREDAHWDQAEREVSRGEKALAGATPAARRGRTTSAKAAKEPKAPKAAGAAPKNAATKPRQKS